MYKQKFIKKKQKISDSRNLASFIHNYYAMENMDVEELENEETSNCAMDAEIMDQIGAENNTIECENIQIPRTEAGEKNLDAVDNCCGVCGRKSFKFRGEKIGLHKLMCHDRAKKFLEIISSQHDDVYVKFGHIKTPTDLILSECYYHSKCLRQYEQRYDRNKNSTTLLQNSQENNCQIKLYTRDLFFGTLKFDDSFDELEIPILNSSPNFELSESFEENLSTELSNNFINCSNNILNNNNDENINNYNGHNQNDHIEKADILTSDDGIDDFVPPLKKYKPNRIETNNESTATFESLILDIENKDEQGDFLQLPKQRKSNKIVDNSTQLKQNAIKNVMSILIPEINEGTSFALSDIRDKVNDLLPESVGIYNYYLLNFLETAFASNIEFSNTTDSKPTYFVYNKKLSKADFCKRLQPKNLLKEAGYLIR